jgi:hypothetical protein
MKFFKNFEINIDYPKKSEKTFLSNFRYFATSKIIKK